MKAIVPIYEKYNLPEPFFVFKVCFLLASTKPQNTKLGDRNINERGSRDRKCLAFPHEKILKYAIIIIHCVCVYSICQKFGHTQPTGDKCINISRHCLTEVNPPNTPTVPPTFSQLGDDAACSGCVLTQSKYAVIDCKWTAPRTPPINQKADCFLCAIEEKEKKEWIAPPLNEWIVSVVNYQLLQGLFGMFPQLKDMAGEAEQRAALLRWSQRLACW